MIELLVVLSFMALLIAMLLPAVLARSDEPGASTVPGLFLASC